MSVQLAIVRNVRLPTEEAFALLDRLLANGFSGEVLIRSNGEVDDHE